MATPGKVRTTDAEIDAALERARLLPDPPMATSAAYDKRLDVIVLKLNSGRRVVIPRENLQGLESATEEQIAHIEIFGGLDIAWPELDLDHYLPALMEGIYGSDRWMQSLDKRAAA